MGVVSENIDRILRLEYSMTGIDMTVIHPLLDRESQIKARQYEKEKRLLGIANLLLSLASLIIFYGTGFSAFLANLNLGSSIIGTFFLYAVIFYSAMSILVLPLAFFTGFVHEHKWNFSNHTVKSWLWEQFKAFFVGMFIFVLLLGLLLWIMAVTPKWW